MGSAHLCRPTGIGYLMGFSATTIERMGTKLMADAEGVSSSGPFHCEEWESCPSRRKKGGWGTV